MNVGKRVLLVEDDALIREFLCEFLRARGYCLNCCMEGETALKKAEDAPPDVFITDYRLPGMNGAAFVKLMRPLHPNALIIGMSSEDKARVFREAGADCFLQKPFPVQNLLSLITGWSSNG